MHWAQVAVCLLFAADVPANPSPAVESTAQKALDTLSARAAFVFTELTDKGPQLLYGINAEERLAIGSSFKLYIFGTLVDEVNAGRRRLDDTMLLYVATRSAPRTAKWPPGRRARPSHCIR